MAVAYGTDLRERVLSFIEEGHSGKESSKIFKVAQSTISLWRSLKRETGDVKPQKTGTKGKRKIDYDALKARLESAPDLTLQELADEFKVWPSAIENALKKMKITRKKRLSNTRKRTQRKEGIF